MKSLTEPGPKTLFPEFYSKAWSIISLSTHQCETTSAHSLEMNCATRGCITVRNISRQEGWELTVLMAWMATPDHAVCF